MKEFFQIVWALIKWVLSSALILVLGILIFGSNLPGIFVVVSMLIAAAIVFPNSKSVKRKKNVLSSENQKSTTYDPDKEFKIPLSQKKREALAQSILDNIQMNIKLATRSEVFGAFIAWYDDIWNDTWKLTLLEKYVKFTGPGPTYEMEKLQNDFQWHLRDAMERHKDRIIRESKSTYRNYPEKTVEECQAFKTSVDLYKERFDQGTIDFANRMMLDLQRECHVSLGVNAESSKPIDCEKNFDNMDGHSFEEFCADILRRNGYDGVTVTPGSGDQGVDIIAEKDKTKYAIQCKRYSSDLGNTPIQEVNAGKVIYGCHVACVLTNRYFTQGAKDAARATGVVLWDRDTLSRMIEIAQG